MLMKKLKWPARAQQQSICRVWVGVVIAELCVVLAGTAAFAQEDVPEDAEELVITEVDAHEGLPPSEEACFNSRNARNFDAISDDFIYLEERRGNHFLLTMDGSCFALAGATGIAISNQMSRVCSRDFARVSYRAIGQVESCRIRRVERVDSKAAAEQIAESRKD